MPNFVKFEGRNKRQEDRITVTKSQGIGFPTKFYQENGLKDYKYVILYWDKDSKVIGIQFSNDETEKSKFSILRSTQGYGGSIAARSFFKENDVDTQQYYGRYHWEKTNVDGIGQLYTVALKERQN